MEWDAVPRKSCGWTILLLLTVDRYSVDANLYPYHRCPTPNLVVTEMMIEATGITIIIMTMTMTMITAIPVRRCLGNAAWLPAGII